MDPVVYQESPLAEYLKGQCQPPPPPPPRDPGAVRRHAKAHLTVFTDEDDESQEGWAEVDSQSERPASMNSDTSPPASPSQFAPSGRPLVKQRFRNKAPPPLQTGDMAIGPLRALRRNYSVSVVGCMSAPPGPATNVESTGRRRREHGPSRQRKVSRTISLYNYRVAATQRTYRRWPTTCRGRSTQRRRRKRTVVAVQ